MVFNPDLPAYTAHVPKPPVLKHVNEENTFSIEHVDYNYVVFFAKF